MFDDIGRKLKTLAKVSTILGIIGSVIAGCALMGDDFLTGLLILVLGSVFSWIGSFTVYGLGQLIENTDALVKQGQVQVQQGRVQIQQNVSTPAPQAAPVYDAPTPTPVQSVPTMTSVSTNASPFSKVEHQTSQTPVAGIPADPGKIFCPICGTVQNANRRVCFSCAQPLIPTEL